MAETKILNVLLAPNGQLSGHGQLRESMSERRTRMGDDYPMWYLNSTLVKQFKVSEMEGMEAVIAEEKSTIAWLKLRFGGERFTKSFDPDELWEKANVLPEPAEKIDISIKK